MTITSSIQYNKDANEPGASDVLSILGMEWMHNGQVAVYAHACDEKDRYIEIED